MTKITQQLVKALFFQALKECIYAVHLGPRPALGGCPPHRGSHFARPRHSAAFQDSTLCVDAYRYLSAVFLCMSAMMQLELPHINVLSKIDLVLVPKRCLECRDPKKT